MNKKSDEIWKQWHFPLFNHYNSQGPQMKRLQHRIFHAVLLNRFPKKAAGQAGMVTRD
ncbi:hypothetical protein AB434_4010 [Heyndrickxia coagulans]|uniref:Uncharacterized protein n=1 Tax=Heyndrickxia coagulans TaxID=1398 RepID=A0AAN0T3E8_HEYCO|nr:hypothetical protein SB48_HM08orf01927 [Heyndrickxia coagulans]AKN56415.1 hypothetical protein AB434_4010 [Heyndrickxia coagulans]